MCGQVSTSNRKHRATRGSSCLTSNLGQFLFGGNDDTLTEPGQELLEGGVPLDGQHPRVAPDPVEHTPRFGSFLKDGLDRDAGEVGDDVPQLLRNAPCVRDVSDDESRHPC